MKVTIMINNKKPKAYCFGFFIALLLFFSCQKQNYDANQIVAKSIEVHGGLKKWRSIKEISFDKKTILYFPDGTIEKELNQHQMFSFVNGLKGSIQDLNTEGMYGFDFDGKSFLVTDNDSIRKVEDVSEIESFKYSFFASHYVICQPFELLNENAELIYDGMSLIDNKEYYRVNVIYKDDDKDSDKWTYFFDDKTFDLMSCKVDLTDHTSLIENLKYDNSTGFKFNAYRKSYRLNEVGEKEYLRAEYWYSNYEVIL